MKEYNFTINGHEYNVRIDSVDDAKASVCVNGKDYEITFSGRKDDAPLQETPAPSTVSAVSPISTSKGNVTSPLPGIVVEICVSEGQSVKAGQKVATLEAMKMENDILSEFDGKVGKVFVSKGDSILEGAAIIEII